MSNFRLDFICVGPQRTATSWLHQYLKLHPRVALPRHVKETMFFDEHFHKGMPWYRNHFDRDLGDQLCGEIGPTYFDNPEAIERLKTFEGIKIIIVVRDPVERTYSLFRHHRSKGRVPDDYTQAVKIMPRIETSGRYAEHCPKWEEAFGANHCLYLLQNQIKADPQAIFNRLCQFLGLDALALPEEAFKPFGAATKPPSSSIAKISARFSTAIRSRGLHWPIEMLKKLGLRSLIFGKPAGQEPIPEQIASHLAKLHANDVRYLETKLTDPPTAGRSPN